MEEKKLKLVLVNEENEIIGGYEKFEKREDLYIYLGLIINKSTSQITVNYLQFYDSEFDHFEIWVNYALKNANVLCEFTQNNKIYKIKIK